MLWTDYMGRVSMLFRNIACLTLLTITSVIQLQAQALVCDNQVNVSLSDQCEAEITVDMILESTIDPASIYSINIEGVIGTTVTTPGIYKVTISNETNPNTCWGFILVEDKIAPTISCPCDPNNPVPGEDCTLPILCEDFGDIGGANVTVPTITDNCLDVDDFVLTFNDDVDGEDCTTSLVTRTWTFTDPDGNRFSCVSEYSISPLALANLVTPPTNTVNLDCGTGTTPAEVYQYVFNNFPPCTLPSCLDPTNPMHEDAVANYEALRQKTSIEAAYPTINGLPLDGVVCNSLTSFSDTVLPICSSAPGCEGNAKIIREWTIYDWCNPLVAPIAFSQVIKASDNTPPTLHVEGFTRSVDPWGCSTTIVFPAPIKLADNCTNNISYIVTGSGSTDIYDINFDPVLGYFVEDLPVGQHTFFYNAYDCCDNVASEGIVVTVKDATPPVAITKQDIVISLIPNPGNFNEPGLTKMFATSVDNGSYDGCGPVKLEIRRDAESCNSPNNLTFNNDFHPMDDSLDLDDGKFVTFCCQDLVNFGVDEDGDGINDFAQIKVWLRVFDDGDRDGVFGSAGDNYSEVWSFVRLEDKSRPTIVCPGDVVIDCDADAGDLTLTGEAFGVSSCGTVDVTYTDTRDLSNCNEGIITRRWSAVGSPAIFCNQKITLSGDFFGGPVQIFFPVDTLISCTDELMEMRPTWTSGRCDQLAYSVDRDTFFFAEGACYKILNYWTVIDWCTYDPNVVNSDGIWSDVQVVKVIDEDAPTLISCNDAIIPVLDLCESNAVMLTNSATDAGVCASTRLQWTVQVDLNRDWTIDYTFSSQAPVSSPFYIPPSASGEEIKITLPEGVSGSMINHRVVWKVSDGCGNNTSCTSSFMVVDQKPPTPYCVNLSTALMVNGQVELWACDFDLGAFDNCTAQEDLRFTFTNVNPDNDPAYIPSRKCSAKIFSCDDLNNPAGTIVSVQVYVWDEKDNFDFCTVFLTLVDNNNSCDDIGSRPVARIGGDIETELGERVEDVMIEIVSPQPNYPTAQMTDAQGHFMFANNPFTFNYQISGTKNDDYLNGVSTLDIVIIQRHILRSKMLNSPYKMVAADVNNDNAITALDLIELRKLILGIYDVLPENDSWRFVDENSIIDPNHPWPFTESRLIQGLENNMMQENFIGVKVGDVNGSVTANATQSEIESRSANAIELQYTDVSFQTGEQIEMTVSLDEQSSLTGLQFTLETQGLELMDIVSTGLDVEASNFAQLSSEMTTFSWNATEEITTSDLFTFVFKATSSGKLSDNVAITSGVTKAEAYGSEISDVIPVQLAGRNNPEQDYSLLQNNPNPFNRMTTIDFVLPVRSSATLSIMDVNGRTIWSVTQEFSKGLNSFELTDSQLSTSGVLYYRLESGEFSATKKMIKIN